MQFIRENFALVMVWLFGIFISVTCYIAFQNVFPTWGEVALAHTLYAIPAMPNAFLHMVNFYPDYAAHTDYIFWAFAALYWALIGTVHYWYFEERLPNYVLVITILVMLSSVRWLYFAEALIHAK